MTTDVHARSGSPVRRAETARTPGALVIDSNHAALGVVRSLGRQGVPVWLLQRSPSSASWSRYTERTVSWPDDDDGQRACLLDLEARHGLRGWCVFPTDDQAVVLLARHHDVLGERYRLASAPWEMVRWALDKRLTHRLTAELDLPSPRTWFPAARTDVASLECAFPVLLKPAVKESSNPFTEARAWRVDDRRALIARYDEACRFVDADVVMVQELVSGGGEAQLSYAALCADGRPIASIVARRVRQRPVDFGRFSTCVETVDCAAVEQAGRRFLEAIRYTGLVEIEFKRDAETGEHKLLDVNPRTWGWHALGQAAGVDFPFLQWRMLSGDHVGDARARTGVRWVLLRADVRTALTEMRRGRLGPIGWLRSLRPPVAFAILARDDPLPALVDGPLLAWSRLRAAARSHADVGRRVNSAGHHRHGWARLAGR